MHHLIVCFLSSVIDFDIRSLMDWLRPNPIDYLLSNLHSVDMIALSFGHSIKLSSSAFIKFHFLTSATSFCLTALSSTDSQGPCPKLRNLTKCLSPEKKSWITSLNSKLKMHYSSPELLAVWSTLLVEGRITGSSSTYMLMLPIFSLQW